MDTDKPKPIRVGLRTEGESMHEVTTEASAPRVPVIGGKPDKKTQNVPLLQILAEINFRRKTAAPPPESTDKA